MHPLNRPHAKSKCWHLQQLAGGQGLVTWRSSSSLSACWQPQHKEEVVCTSSCLLLRAGSSVKSCRMWIRRLCQCDVCACTSCFAGLKGCPRRRRLRTLAKQSSGCKGAGRLHCNMPSPTYASQEAWAASAQFLLEGGQGKAAGREREWCMPVYDNPRVKKQPKPFFSSLDSQTFAAQTPSSLSLAGRLTCTAAESSCRPPCSMPSRTSVDAGSGVQQH